MELFFYLIGFRREREKMWDFFQLCLLKLKERNNNQCYRIYSCCLCRFGPLLLWNQLKNRLHWRSWKCPKILVLLKLLFLKIVCLVFLWKFGSICGSVKELNLFIKIMFNVFKYLKFISFNWVFYIFTSCFFFLIFFIYIL